MNPTHREYKVELNDTLSSIAVKFNTSPEYLKRLNKFFSLKPVVYPGQKITVPIGTDETTTGKLQSSHLHKIPGFPVKLENPSVSDSNIPIEDEDIMVKQFVKVPACRILTLSEDMKERVTGTIMASPDCILFEPSQEDPLVLQKGLFTYHVSLYWSEVKGLCSRTEPFQTEAIHSTVTSSTNKPNISESPTDQLTFSITSSIASNTQKGSLIYLLMHRTATSNKSLLEHDPSESACENSKDVYIFEMLREHALSITNFAAAFQNVKQTSKSGCEQSSCSMNKPSPTPPTEAVDSNKDSTSGNNCSQGRFRVDRILQEMEAEDFYLPHLTDGESRILTPDRLHDLTKHLPARLSGSNLRCVYSTEMHGFSLHTIYRKMGTCVSAALLLIEDTNKKLFGSLMSDKMQISQYFYGKGETFVFHWNLNFKCYKWTGKNSFFMKGDTNSFSIGVRSGHNAIWFEEMLKYGRSEETDTFDNPVLCGGDSPAFQIATLEVWTFYS